MVGSSRYSSTPASSWPTFMDVSGVQAPFGSSRKGRAGNSWRKACITSMSVPGGKNPPFSLMAEKPYSAIMRRAWATIPSASSASPHSSGTAPGCPAHL